jgi:PhnB protein
MIDYSSLLVSYAVRSLKKSQRGYNCLFLLYRTNRLCALRASFTTIHFCALSEFYKRTECDKIKQNSEQKFYLRRLAMSFKPNGYNSLSPYIVVDDGQGLINFLEAAFEATVMRRFDGEDGRIIHAEVQIDDTILMLSGSGEGFPAVPVWLHLYVADVDQSYSRALAAGGQSIKKPLHEEGDPDKRGGVQDPAGNTWWISTAVV